MRRFSERLLFTLKACPFVTAGTIGLCGFTQWTAALAGVELPEQTNVALVRALAGWNWRFAFNVFLIVALLPVLEELVFRGALFALPKRFLRRFAIVFAAVSSAMFSSAHYLTQPFPDNAFVALFAFGLAQCWLYAHSGRIWCPMLNHSLFNLVNLVLLFVIPQ